MTSEERSLRVIFVGPQQRTPEEQALLDAQKEADRTVGSMVENAKTLTEFIAAYEAQRQIHLEDITWMRQHGPVTPEAILGFFHSDAAVQDAKKDTKAAEELKTVLDAIPDEPGKIKMVLKRVRYGPHNYIRYVVLAQFPAGEYVEDRVYGITDRDTTRTPDIVMFSPETSCSLHACDDLFKATRGTAFYIDFNTGQEAMRNLDRTPGGAAEYQLSRGPESTIKQDAGNYLLVGLHGRFTNEPRVARVSKFWNRPATP